MFQSDDAPDLLRAFDRRDYLLSEAGQFEDSQARAQDEEHSARAQDEATAWRRSLSAGDTIPGEDAYDFAAMARDGVWPKPDGSGRVPLSPRYWKPGRLVVAGHDLATGRRVLSSAPLEERVLGDLPDETDADTIEQILAQAKPEDLAELSGVERNSLEAWTESHGLMLAQGGTQATQTDITNGTIGPIPRNQVQEVVGRLGSWIQRLATELDKAGISIPTPLENDPRISLKDITVGDLGKVLEDISYGFWPISGGNAATGGIGTFGLKTDALEVMNAAPAVGAAGKVMKKGAEALAPTAKEMVRKGAEATLDASGGRMRVLPEGQAMSTIDAKFINDPAVYGVPEVAIGDGGAIVVRTTERIQPSQVRDRVRKALLAEFTPKLPDGVFWRFTNNPKELDLIRRGELRPSFDRSSNTAEAGLSVADHASYSIAGFRHGYLVKGRVIGTGADGEPILDLSSLRPQTDMMQSAQAIKRDKAEQLKLLQAKGWTYEQFQEAMERLNVPKAIP